MLTVRVRLKGINELIAKNTKVIKAIESGEVTDAVMKKMVRRAKYRGPRDKGHLVRGIRGKKTGKHSFKITCDVENEQGENYPEFLEHGTRFIKVGTESNPKRYKSTSGKTAFRPYISWAKWKTLQEISKIFKERVLKFYI